MNDLDQLIAEVSELTSSTAPAVTELRIKLVELDEYVHSPAYEALDQAGRARFQAAYKELRDATLRDRFENPPAGGPAPSTPAAASFETSLPGVAGGLVPSNNRAAETPEFDQHNPLASQQMEGAESFFYGGRYAEAIKLYDAVLQIEPRWERARQHRGESENYLRTGHIPSVALPPDAASAFGKAQSAARLGRYADALAMLNKAQSALRDLGIQRWQDGQEFEQKLQQYIDAESVYGEGVQLFTQGMVDDAIERVDAAAQATGLPRYIDRVQEMRKARSTMQTIAEGLTSASADPKNIAQVKTGLDALYLQYGENPAFRKLKERFQALIPAAVEPLKDQARALKTQADQSQTLDAAAAKARQAKELLDQARNLGYSDETILQLQGEIEKLSREVQRYEDELQQGITVFNSNRARPAPAAQISQNVRARYPNDPRVVEFNRMLQPYRSSRLLMRGLYILIGLAVLGGLLAFGFNKLQGYVLSLTPTVTVTPTVTPSYTPLPPTVTLTPQPSLTPTITPTPLAGIVLREVWVRNGCYETFKAIGQVKSGSTVRFLPADRQFDNVGRECLLVEYDAPDRTSLIGWILIADVASEK
jgi:tetratricopeptide (TPR) repeat protein